MGLAQQCCNRAQDQAKAQRRQRRRRQLWRLAVLDHVGHQRHAGKSRSNSLHFGNTLRRLDKQDIRTRRQERSTTAQGFIQAMGSTGIRAGDNQQRRVTPRLHGRNNLARRLFQADHLFALHMPTTFWTDLVFQLNGRHPGPFI